MPNLFLPFYLRQFSISIAKTSKIYDFRHQISFLVIKNQIDVKDESNFYYFAPIFTRIVENFYYDLKKGTKIVEIKGLK